MKSKTEDQHQGQRHDDHQPALCPLQVLELSAVLNPVPRRRQRYLFGNLLLRLGHEASQVTTAARSM